MSIFRHFTAAVLFAVMPTLLSCSSRQEGGNPPRPQQKGTSIMSASLDTATLGGGCFWCIEAVYLLLDGVVNVESGYAGGTVENPTYKQICTGTTGHAEVCRITFDPSKVSYEDILHVFFSSHDPTTLNRQGNDVGTQYRSVIFTHSAEQDSAARLYIAQLEAAKTWSDPIVTEIAQAPTFFKAEDYHQNYFARNGDQPYCAFVVRPKVEKFKKQFSDKMKQ